MNIRDIALTGIPRGGTTLACQLLGGCRNALALFEPMDVLALPLPPVAAVAAVRAYFADVREQVVRDGVAPSKQRDGRVPDNPFGEGREGLERPLLATPGLICPPHPLDQDFVLAIKHNAAFTALLPELAQAMPVLAIVRNPLAVLSSWNTVPLPVREGRLPAGEYLDPELASALHGRNDVLARQLLILDWFLQRYRNHLPMANILRYEDIINAQGAPLYQAAGVRPLAPPSLQLRNPVLRADPARVAALADALLITGGAWRNWYEDADIVALAAVAQGGGAD